jgi:HK97 family phage major capsid protein
MDRKDRKTIIGYRKSGAPIYLARGGAPTRRKPEVIEAEISRATATIFEVEDMESPAEEDISRSDTALALIPDLEAELAEAVEREDAIQRLRDRADDPDATEPGDQRDTPPIQRRRDRGAPAVVRGKGDEFDILRSNTQHMGEVEYRDALVDSIQRASERYEMPDNYTDSLPKFVKRHRKDASWSKNILQRMDPNYITAFEKVVVGDTISLTDIERAAIAVGTNTAGGYLVPTHLDPTLILTNAGAKDVVRGISRVVTLTGGANKWNGVTTAGSTASWDAELTEVSDDTPAIGPAQVPVYSAKSLIQASIESFEDITGLASDVQMLLQDSKVRLEAAAHMTGSGSGQPTGIFTALDANTNVEISLATGSTFTRTDLAGVANALGDRWSDGSRWLMHPGMLERIAALGTVLGASYSVDLTQALTEQLLGFPITRSFTAPNTFQTTTIDNLLVFGDFSNFVIVDKPGSTSIEFIPHLFNTSNNLPDGRRAWYMHFRNGSDSVNDLAFRLLQDRTTA